MAHHLADEGDWKFADWEWDADSLSEDDLFSKIDQFMQAVGWSRVTPTGNVDTDYTLTQSDLDTYGYFYLRTDRSTIDNWDYLGMGAKRSCGIFFVKTNPDVGFGESGNPYAGSWISSDDESNVEVFCHSYNRILFTTTGSGVHNLRLLGGTHGLFLQLDSPGNNADAAFGAIVTHNWDPARAGTRLVAGAKLASQGVGIDFNKALQSNYPGSTDARYYRLVLNDGLNSNKTAQVCFRRTHACDDKLGGAPSKHRKDYMLNEDVYFGMQGAEDTPWGIWSTFGLPSAAQDDRWRIGKLSWYTLTGDTGNRKLGLYSTVNNDNLAAATINNMFTKWWDPRELFSLPKMVVVSDRMSPWQVITDQQEGKDYYIVRLEDDGRPVCVGFEWPGPGNEIDLSA
jgi:hypothetical protein